MAANVARLKRDLEALKTARADLDGIWDQIEKYILPLTGKVMEQTVQIPQTDWECWDFTAPLANEHLAAALGGSVVPESARWFGLEYQDAELREDQDSLRYLEQLTELVWTELRNSDFAMEIGAGLLEYTGLGNIALVVEPTDELIWDGLDFSAVPVREVYFQEDTKGGVETFFRILKWTPAQIVDRFENDKRPLPNHIVEAAAAGGDQANQRLDVAFAIFCREEADSDRNEAGKHQPLPGDRREYGFVYFELGTGEQLGDEGGYYEMPAVIGRWAKRPNTQWGFGRGNLALRTVKYLNSYLDTARAAAEKVVDPAALVTERGLMSDLDQRPGGQTVVADLENSVKAFESGARFDVSAEVVADLRMEIRRLFHEDDLQLKDSPQMTATEVQARRDLMNRSLGAPVGRLQNDVLTPLIRIVLGHLERAGRLPPVPNQVKAKRAEIAVSYYGAISRAQRVDEVASIERLASFAAGLAKSDPEHADEVWDLFDRDQAMREAALRLGTPALVLKSKERVAKERQVKAQLRAEQQQAELAATQAGAAKDAASAVATMPGGAQGGGLSGGLPLGISPQPALLPSTGYPPGY